MGCLLWLHISKQGVLPCSASCSTWHSKTQCAARHLITIRVILTLLVLQYQLIMPLICCQQTHCAAGGVVDPSKGHARLFSSSIVHAQVPGIGFQGVGGVQGEVGGSAPPQ